MRGVVVDASTDDNIAYGDLDKRNIRLIKVDHTGDKNKERKAGEKSWKFLSSTGRPNCVKKSRPN